MTKRKQLPAVHIERKIVNVIGTKKAKKIIIDTAEGERFAFDTKLFTGELPRKGHTLIVYDDQSLELDGNPPVEEDEAPADE